MNIGYGPKLMLRARHSILGTVTEIKRCFRLKAFDGHQNNNSSTGSSSSSNSSNSLAISVCCVFVACLYAVGCLAANRRNWKCWTKAPHTHTHTFSQTHWKQVRFFMWNFMSECFVGHINFKVYVWICFVWRRRSKVSVGISRSMWSALRLLVFVYKRARVCVYVYINVHPSIGVCMDEQWARFTHS